MNGVLVGNENRVDFWFQPIVSLWHLPRSYQSRIIDEVIRHFVVFTENPVCWKISGTGIRLECRLSWESVHISLKHANWCLSNMLGLQVVGVRDFIDFYSKMFAYVTELQFEEYYLFVDLENCINYYTVNVYVIQKWITWNFLIPFVFKWIFDCIFKSSIFEFSSFKVSYKYRDFMWYEVFSFPWAPWQLIYHCRAPIRV